MQPTCKILLKKKENQKKNQTKKKENKTLRPKDEQTTNRNYKTYQVNQNMQLITLVQRSNTTTKDEYLKIFTSLAKTCKSCHQL